MSFLRQKYTHTSIVRFVFLKVTNSQLFVNMLTLGAMSQNYDKKRRVFSGQDKKFTFFSYLLMVSIIVVWLNS